MSETISEDKIEVLKRVLIDKAPQGRLPCAVARALAEEYGVSYKTVGQLADELKIKIVNCELGCF